MSYGRTLAALGTIIGAVGVGYTIGISDSLGGEKIKEVVVVKEIESKECIKIKDSLLPLVQTVQTLAYTQALSDTQPREVNTFYTLARKHSQDGQMLEEIKKDAAIMRLQAAPTDKNVYERTSNALNSIINKVEKFRDSKTNKGA